jgi:leader peptidase (prepilin peptidase)/N-methyltransferase
VADVLALLEAHAGYTLACATVLGLLVGSFLNVVVLRLPPRLFHRWAEDARDVLATDAAPEPVDAAKPPPDLVFTRSHCPTCGHQLRWWENIPLASWLALRGRCSACRTPISMQYPLVETLTAVLTVAVVWRYGLTWTTVVALAFTWVLVAAAVIDLRTQYLFDELTLPLLWLGLLAAAAGITRPTDDAVIGAAVGYLSLWSVYWIFKLLTGKEGMGYGDFKLLAALGAFCGVMGLLPIILLSSLFGALIGGIWLALRGRDRATPIPFGPFLAAAGWVQFVHGEAILAWYTALLPG